MSRSAGLGLDLGDELEMEEMMAWLDEAQETILMPTWDALADEVALLSFDGTMDIFGLDSDSLKQRLGRINASLASGGAGAQQSALAYEKSIIEQELEDRTLLEEFAVQEGFEEPVSPVRPGRSHLAANREPEATGGKAAHRKAGTENPWGGAPRGSGVSSSSSGSRSRPRSRNGPRSVSAELRKQLAASASDLVWESTSAPAHPSLPSGRKKRKGVQRRKKTPAAVAAEETPGTRRPRRKWVPLDTGRVKRKGRERSKSMPMPTQASESESYTSEDLGHLSNSDDEHGDAGIRVDISVDDMDGISDDDEEEEVVQHVEEADGAGGSANEGNGEADDHLPDRGVNQETVDGEMEEEYEDEEYEEYEAEEEEEDVKYDGHADATDDKLVGQHEDVPSATTDNTDTMEHPASPVAEAEPEPEQGAGATASDTELAPSPLPAMVRESPSPLVEEVESDGEGAEDEDKDVVELMMEAYPNIPRRIIERYAMQTEGSVDQTSNLLYRLLQHRSTKSESVQQQQREQQEREQGPSVTTLPYVQDYPKAEALFGGYYTGTELGIDALLSHLKADLEAWREAMHAFPRPSSTTEDEATEEEPLEEHQSQQVSPAHMCYHVRATQRPEISDILLAATSTLGQEWTDTSKLQVPAFNVLWTWKRPKIDFERLLIWQRVNHFPNSLHLTHKDQLKKHVARYTALGGRTAQMFHFTPDSYLLPKEYVAFADAYTQVMEEDPEHNLWIMKPLGSSQGRGIYLVDDITSIVYGQAMIIQRYIKDPLLLRGFKFDLRLYVLVTSFEPMEVWLYDEGFARLSTQPYSTRSQDLDNLFIHLTNSSIQKDSETPNVLSDDPGKQGGSKISLAFMNELLAQEGVDVAAMWANIQQVIVKSLFCVQEHITQNPACFELYGYDILVDQNLKAWLIEVNASPSMATATPLDERIKTALIADTLRLIRPLSFDRDRLLAYIEARQAHVEAARKSLAGRADVRTLLRDFDAAMHEILDGQHERKVPDDEPQHTGQYTRIVPSAYFDTLTTRLRRGDHRLRSS